MTKMKIILISILFVLICGAWAGNRQEIIEKRSYNSKTFDNGDGSYTVETSLDYLHYKDSDGRFKPIRRDIKPSSRAGYGYEVTEGMYFFRLKDGNRAPEAVTFTSRSGGGAISFRVLSMGYYERTSGRYRVIESVKNKTARVLGNRAVFKNILAGIDLEYVYQSDRLKENIYISPRARKGLPGPGDMGLDPAQTYLMFESEYEVAGNLRLFHKGRDIGDEDYATTDRMAFRDTNGEVQFFFANDLATFQPLNASEPWEEEPVLKRIYLAGEKRMMLSGVSVEWLNSLAPGLVIIDPSIALNSPSNTQDAYVYKWLGNSASQDNNYGSSGIIRTLAWTKNGINKFERTFIQFDLSTVPSGARITAAQLDLTNDGSPHGGGNSSRYGQASTYLSRVTGAWNEYSITWNNMPGITTSNRVSIPAPSDGYSPMSADVTGLVKDILNSEEGNNGFEMRLQTEQKYRSVRYASTQHNDANRWPKLTVTYTQLNEAYYLKDHLGNIRVTLDGNGNVLTSDDYYPFGLLEPGRRRAETPTPRGKCPAEVITLP